MSRRRCADVLVAEMVALGMRKCFSVSGNQIMAIYDAAIGSGLEIIHTRHEAAAVHMADAWGRLTGEPGLALVTAGPGFTNCLTALYVAKMAESPVVLLSGDAGIGTDGRGGFQELDQVAMAGPVVKRSWRAKDPRSIGQDLARAVALAKAGRPGPVHLSLPVDVVEAEHPAEQFRPAENGERTVVGVTAEAEQNVVSIVRSAKRLLLIAGPAAMRGAAFCELRDFGMGAGAAVVGMESPRGLNDPSIGAFAEVAAKADVVVLAGKPLDSTLNFGAAPGFHPKCRFVQIDADQPVLAQARRNIPEEDRLYQAIADDAIATALRCLRTAGAGALWESTWPEEVRRAVEYRPQAWRLATAPQQHTVSVLDAVQEFLDGGDDSIFITDGGEFGQWAQACIKAGKRVINGTSGGIGGSIPFAIGARAAFPDARIVTVLGDGTMGFHATEFDTALRCDLPFLAVIGNDAGWNAEIQIQIQRFGADRAVGCELLPTRYDRLAEALGCFGRHAETVSDVRDGLREAWDSRKPACIDVKVNRTPAPIVRNLPPLK
jgi:acetolactate synthase-1/2/3 large subunit